MIWTNLHLCGATAKKCSNMFQRTMGAHANTVVVAVAARSAASRILCPTPEGDGWYRHEQSEIKEALDPCFSLTSSGVALASPRSPPPRLPFHLEQINSNQ